MLATLARRAADPSLPLKLRAAARTPPTAVNSQFTPKKVWPPDFSKLSQKEQFRLERKYKRRVALATARPKWDRFVRIAQFVSVTGVLVYSILFMEWNTDTQPFQGVRDAFWSTLGAFSPDQRYERRKSETSGTSVEK